MVYRKYLAGKRLVNLVNCQLFAKIFLTNSHRYTDNVFGICTDCSLFAKFFLALLPVPKFSHVRYIANTCSLHQIKMPYMRRLPYLFAMASSCRALLKSPVRNCVHIWYSGKQWSTHKYSIHEANPSLSQRCVHHSMVTRLPNHWWASSWPVIG